MGLDRDRLITGLKNITPFLTFDEGAARGRHAVLCPEPAHLPACAALLLEHGFYLVFITAVHVSPACEVIYQFAHYESFFRINLQVAAGEGRSIPSLAGIYQGAAWHEREVYEFFGVEFQGHPGLKPIILTRDEKGLHPLLRHGQHLKKREEVFSGETHE